MSDPITPTRRSSPLARWRQLPAGERALALKLACLMPVIDLSLRSVGYQRSRDWVARLAPDAAAATLAADADAVATAQRLAWLARAIGARSPWRTSCLRQSLAVWLLLRRRRLPAEIRIGVARGDLPFRAHAWVELAGVALDPDAAEFTAFVSIDRPPGELL